jgi:hypothetical protein
VSKLAVIRTKVPWLMLFEVARMTHGHLMEATSATDRKRVVAIVKRSHGDWRRLTVAEKADLKRIAGKIDLKQVALGVAPRALRGKR